MFESAGGETMANLKKEGLPWKHRDHNFAGMNSQMSLFSLPDPPLPETAVPALPAGQTQAGEQPAGTAASINDTLLPAQSSPVDAQELLPQKEVLKKPDTPDVPAGTAEPASPEMVDFSFTDASGEPEYPSIIPHDGPRLPPPSPSVPDPSLLHPAPGRPVLTEEPENGLAKSRRGRKPLKSLALRLEELTIPPDETLFEKQYYPAGIVAGWLNLPPATLRLWTNEFTVLKPRKTRKGDRLYRPEDVKMLVLIYQLIRERKYSMEGARQYLELHRHQLSAQQQIFESLTKFRSFLLTLKANLGA